MKLLPCPFCGAKAFVGLVHQSGQQDRIRCSDPACGASIVMATPGRWNQRAAQDEEDVRASMIAEAALDPLTWVNFAPPLDVKM